MHSIHFMHLWFCDCPIETISSSNCKYQIELGWPNSVFFFWINSLRNWKSKFIYFVFRFDICLHISWLSVLALIQNSKFLLLLAKIPKQKHKKWKLQLSTLAFIDLIKRYWKRTESCELINLLFLRTQRKKQFQTQTQTHGWCISCTSTSTYSQSPPHAIQTIRLFV